MKDLEKYNTYTRSDTGVIAGHDFDIAFYGVARAAIRWARNLDIPLYLGADSMFWVYNNNEV